MQIMMMHVDVIHRNARFLGGADYGSRKGGDLWFDPDISKHDAFAATLRKNFDAPVGPLLPQNMPGYQAHGKYKPVGDPIDNSIHHFLIGASLGLPPHQSFSVCPSIIEFGDPTITETTLNLSNSNFSDAEFSSTCFPWMMYGAGTGHFLSTIAENTLPFNITLAVDTTVHGRGFIPHLAWCP